MSLKAVRSNTILVIDDTPSNLQVLFTYLENVGFTVLLAQNGSRALKIIDRTIPDLILLDVLMPDIDGFTLCRQLKARPKTREIPIIFLTALSETSHKIQGFAVGGVDYITKPIEQQEVIARIKNHLALRDLSQSLVERNQKLEREIDIRQQVEIELKQTLDAEASVRRITEKIRDSFDEKQVLKTITQELVKVLKLDGCQIEFYERDRETITIVNEQGIVLKSKQSCLEQIADYPQIYRQLAQKISLQLVTEVPEIDLTKARLKSSFKNETLALNNNSISPKKFRQNSKACSICPIFDNQEPLGTIGNLLSFRSVEKVFQPWEIKLVEQVASQCAIAIHQARLYETSQIQVKELAKLNRLKDDFLKTISHELRSPMSSIQLAVQTLEKLLVAEHKKFKSDRFQRVLGIFRQSCHRQNQLIDDLLTLCHLDAQAGNITTDWIDLQTWIPEIIKPFQEQISNQQQQLIIDIPANLISLNSDPFILERIIRELVNNACKYTPAQKSIKIFAIAEKECMKITIENTGISIPLEERERIFDRFYRIPNNDPWQYGGTGLGLYLVKKLLELLSGKITVESKSDITQFTVELLIHS